MTAPDLFAKPEPPRRGTRLPSDWKPTLEAAKFARGLGLDPMTVADQFRDYWISRAGAGGVKLDWLATWRNWCRVTAERNANKPKPRGVQTNGPNILTPEAPWEQRIRNYKPGGFWSSMWGPRPGEPGCFVPRDIIARWRNGGE